MAFIRTKVHIPISDASWSNNFDDVQNYVYTRDPSYLGNIVGIIHKWHIFSDDLVYADIKLINSPMGIEFINMLEFLRPEITIREYYTRFHAMIESGVPISDPYSNNV